MVLYSRGVWNALFFIGCYWRTDVYKNGRSLALLFYCFGRGTSAARRDQGSGLDLPVSYRGCCRSRYDEKKKQKSAMKTVHHWGPTLMHLGCMTEIHIYMDGCWWIWSNSVSQGLEIVWQPFINWANIFGLAISSEHKLLIVFSWEYRIKKERTQNYLMSQSITQRENDWMTSKEEKGKEKKITLHGNLVCIFSSYQAVVWNFTGKILTFSFFNYFL